MAMKSYTPDYPRPQLVRSSWENLNGSWDFAFDDDCQGLALGFPQSFTPSHTIQVPFSYETARSGIGDQQVHSCVWYSRSFTPDAAQLANGRLMLHFEGSDYKSQVWVNGIFVGSHLGGYARFSFDITQAVQPGENRICVMVKDSLDERQPRGKQRWRDQNFGCWYVQTTGIWKTVWLEYLPKSYLSSLKLTPDLPQESLHICFDVEPTPGQGPLTLEATVSYQDRVLRTVSAQVTGREQQLTVDVRDTTLDEWGVHAWSPDAPHLYDLELRLLDNGQLVDRVLSYFGMREIRICGSSIMLNGLPLYQRLILDQGYWDESHLTPPSEAALIEDIEKIHALGYNGLRKHQKVEDERFLYWCDVKGMLVWSEMASAYRFTDGAVSAFMEQWREIVLQNYSHPCIITWTPVNESWGVRTIKDNPAQQHFTQAIYHLTKSLDPHRPVIVNDGWEHTVSDIITLHDYEEKGDVLLQRYLEGKEDILANRICHNLEKTAFANGFGYRGQPILISEFGGIAFNNDDSGWGYGNKVGNEQEFIRRFDDITTAIKKLPYCCGYCYTQVTDVQQEINGLMDIGRNYKIDPQVICEINKRRVSCYQR